MVIISYILDVSKYYDCSSVLNNCFDKSFFNLLSFMQQSRSLFVKNLNFKTSGESLRKHFSEHMKEGKIRSVRVILLHFRTFPMYYLTTLCSYVMILTCPCAGEGALEKWEECVNGFWFYRVWFSWDSSQCLQQFTGIISCIIPIHITCLKQCISNVLSLYFRVLFWMVMLSSCNYVMRRRMNKCWKRLIRIRVQQN